MSNVKIFFRAFSYLTLVACGVILFILVIKNIAKVPLWIGVAVLSFIILFGTMFSIKEDLKPKNPSRKNNGKNTRNDLIFVDENGIIHPTS